MRILLIGGNGFIGSPLTELLCALGHEVAILHRSADTASRRAGVTKIRGDRNRLTDSQNALQQFAPDVVIDLILSSAEQARELMKVAGKLKAHVVAISSIDVYRAWGVLNGTEPGPPEPLPLRETSPLRTNRRAYPPETLRMMQSVFTWVDERYDKIGVEEEVVNASEASATVLRLPMVYGPGDPLHRFFPLLKRITDNRPVVILPDDLASWRAPRGYVENVAHAIAIAATSTEAKGHLYNVCEEPGLSELEWQSRIAMESGWHGQFVVLPREQTPKHLLLSVNAAQHVVASSERIRTELQYKELIEVKEAIRRTVRWEQENPPRTVNPQQFDYESEDAAIVNAA